MTALSRTLFAPLALGFALTAAAQHAPDVSEVERLVMRQANTLREAQHRPPLEPQPQLASAARDLAEFMARTDRYGHEADGRDAGQRASARGYPHCLIAENIAYQFDSRGFATQALADGLMRGWRESPGHRANLLDRDVVHTGVAVARSERSGRWYAVQVFGRPDTQKIEFRIANRSSGPVTYELDGERFSVAPRETITHTQCTTPRLVVRLPGRDAATLEPRHGERVIVEGAGGTLRLSVG